MSDGQSLVIAEDTEVSRRVALARVAAGLTQEDLARALGVSLATIGRIEQGVRAPRRVQLLALAQITGQDVTFFGLASSAAKGDGTVSPVAPRVNPDETDRLNGALEQRARNVIEDTR